MGSPVQGPSPKQTDTTGIITFPSFVGGSKYFEDILMKVTVNFLSTLMRVIVYSRIK